MFILYPLILGLVLGLLAGGRPAGLGGLRFRWAPLIVLALVAQLILFSAPVAAQVGDLGPSLYVGTTLAVLLAVLRNWSIPGIPIVVAGAASNLLAIVANGGYMPASESALAAFGKVEPTVYSNSALMRDPVLVPLTDIFAMPRWLPGANIFSVGDILIAVGIMVLVVTAMRAAPAGSRTTPVVRADTGQDA